MVDIGMVGCGAVDISSGRSPLFPDGVEMYDEHYIRLCIDTTAPILWQSMQE